MNLRIYNVIIKYTGARIMRSFLLYIIYIIVVVVVIIIVIRPEGKKRKYTKRRTYLLLT